MRKLIETAAIVLGTLLASSPSVALANPGWSLVASPNHAAPQGGLSGTSCSSSFACTAVGSALNSSGVRVTLAQRWDGTSWAIQPTPSPPGVPQSALTAVSCTSATACVAVGYYGSPGASFGSAFIPLAERWDGTTWTLQNTPFPAGTFDSVLSGVSCTSAAACVAAGYYRTARGTMTLVERWDGSAWSIQASPNVVNNAPSVLSAVSCTAPTACTAVGSFYYRSRTGTLAERWDGRSWVLQSATSPFSFTSKLTGVSCTSATACTAVGFSGSSGAYVTLAERWDGTSWATQATPNPAATGDNVLAGVSCTSSASCIAVGYLRSGGLSTTLAERWDGTNWALQAAPSPPAAQSTTFAAVSCTATTACTATGYLHNPSGLDVTLAERWNGTAWAPQATASPTGTQNSTLVAVSCTSATACMAVGQFGGGSAVNVMLAERWDGTTWTIAATPGPTGAQNTTLSGVSCTSAAACTAVGSSGASGGLVPLAERWNGTSWAIQATPNPTGARNSVLTGVSCTSSTDCTAVGYSDAASGARVTLAERWNATGWAVQNTPNPAPGLSGSLTGVSCTSSTSCTAIGDYASNSNYLFVTLAERWDGSSWTIEATPNPTVIGNSVLVAVSCTSSSACVAAGHYNSSGVDTLLAERWNGAGWAIQTTPGPAAAQNSALTGLTCTSATSCTAVGSSGPTYALVTLAEHWDGTSWAIQATPNPPPADNSVLTGVACASTADCTAVGSSSNSLGVQATLVARYTGNSDEPPTAAYTASTYAPETGQAVSFDGSASVDPDGTITSYRWVWGDGTPDGSGPKATHVFSTPGPRSVGLYVSDSDGQNAAVGHAITTAADEQPTATFTPSSSTPTTADTVTFTASASDPDGKITTYRWSWGDGTPDGSGPTATHVFPTQGAYTVSLTATDSSGLTATAAQAIKVSRPHGR